MNIETIEADNRLLHLENDRLRAQVHRLQHNKHYEELLKRLQFLLVENQQLHNELEENKELARFDAVPHSSCATFGSLCNLHPW